MTITDQTRLSQIRADLLQYETAGVDISRWHDTFFIRLVDKLNAEIWRMKKEMCHSRPK